MKQVFSKIRRKKNLNASEKASGWQSEPENYLVHNGSPDRRSVQDQASRNGSKPKPK